MLSAELAAAVDRAPVVDDHCHGFRLADLLARDPAGWEDRLTMMGMCFLSSGQTNPTLAAQASSLRDTTAFLLAARRWLARALGVEEHNLSAARHERLSADPAGYVNGLLRDQRVAAVIADDGYPQPAVPREEFAAALGVPVYRAARIEPMIVALQQQDLLFAEFEEGFIARLDEAAADAATVAFKSIIAYRSGLDVGEPSRQEAAAAYAEWRSSGWIEDRGPAKTVRDYCLGLAFAAARRHDRVVHVHCGGGDPDVRLGHARPALFYDFVHRRLDQPVVLIHAGWPWLAEGAYIASILPNVYLDLSEFLPWASLAGDREVERLLGMVPAAKVLYGSDEASEPEILWLGAKVMRDILKRVLAAAVERDWLTGPEAVRIAQAVLGENARRLHGLS